MSRYDKRDANEQPLIKLAARLGAGFRKCPPLDGLIHYRGRWMPVEIKLPEREGTANEYTPAQLQFFNWCRAHHAKWLAWRTEDDVIRDLGREFG